jgi:hypothetical protein
MRKRRPDLYNNLYCPRCNTYEETFDHVWLCSTNGLTIFHLMQLFKQHLFDALQTFDASLNMSFLSHKFLWNIDSDPLHLTFIDIIKGIIPGFLVEKILRVTNNRKYTIDLLQILYDALYADLKKFIWQPRCDAMISLEKSLNIDKKEKKKHYNFKNSNLSAPTSISLRHGFGNYGLDLAIKLGTNWLDFMITLNHWSVV